MAEHLDTPMTNLCPLLKDQCRRERARILALYVPSNLLAFEIFSFASSHTATVISSVSHLPRSYPPSGLKGLPAAATAAAIPLYLIRQIRDPSSFLLRLHCLGPPRRAPQGLNPHHQLDFQFAPNAALPMQDYGRDRD